MNFGRRSPTMKCSEDNEISNQINILPDELIINIFKYLPLETILACENVCSRWKKLSRDAALWRRIVFLYSGRPGQTHVIEQNLRILETHSECIRCLKMQYVNSYSVIKLIIQQCPNIISLELVMCSLSNELQEDVMRFPNLRKINLKNSLFLKNNDDLLVPYDNFKYLQYLSLADFGLPITLRDSLLRCNNLSCIFIEKIKNLNLEYVQELIRSKKEILNSLHIYGGDAVNDECLVMLSQCDSLKNLGITRCHNLTDAGFSELINLKCIEHLQIWNNAHFTEANLHKTLESPNLVKLQSLSLSRIENISPVIIDMISAYYKNLNFVAIYQCPRIVNTVYEQQLSAKFSNVNIVIY